MARKSKLEKLIERHDHYDYETTIEDCQKWFNILNRELFSNSLPPVDEIDIRWRRGAYAWYDYDERRPGKGLTRLLMNKRYKTKRFFIDVLGHEMIHHHQYIYNESMGHGYSFEKWSDQFRRKGLCLVKAY
jgi:hypothetical protein